MTGLKILRLEHNLAQKDIANLLGVTNTYYGQCERGNRSISLKLAQKAADFYNVPISKIYEEEEEIPENENLTLQKNQKLNISMIKLLRRRKNLTQKDMAKALGISQSYYSSCECGVRQMNDETVQKAANFFDVPLDSLYEREGLTRNITDIPLSILRDLATSSETNVNEFLQYLKYLNNSKEHIKVLDNE